MSLQDDLIDEYRRARKQAKERRLEAFACWLNEYGQLTLILAFALGVMVWIGR